MAKPIIIAGGGIGGFTLALMLHLARDPLPGLRGRQDGDLRTNRRFFRHGNVSKQFAIELERSFVLLFTLEC
jgi:hypothetical protein